MKRLIMKTSAWFARAILLLGLLPLLTGCPKTTGGGWFLSYDEYDDAVIPISFGLTARRTGDAGSAAAAKGRWAMVAHHLDHTTTRIQGDFDLTGGTGSDMPEGQAQFNGTCKVNGEAGYWLVVRLQDYGEPGASAGDGISISVGHLDADVTFDWEGYLEGGNIQVHADKR